MLQPSTSVAAHPHHPTQPPVRKVCSLWVHSPAFSKEEVLFNAAILPRGSNVNGQLLKILPHQPDDTPPLSRNTSLDPDLSRSSTLQSASPLDESHAVNAFVFVARDLSDEQRSKYPNLQISVSEAIASCHAFQNRMSVLLVAADFHQHAASHVELNFKDPLNRDDLWKMIVSELHRKQCLYQGQKLLYLGSIEFTVRKIYVNGQKTASAVFTEQSKPIFRSLAARYMLGIQASREIWDFDGDATCEINWLKTKAFVMELFERWDAANAKHSVSLFFYTRLEYQTDEHSKAETRDYYRVVVSELASSECGLLSTRLDEEFRKFLHDVEHCSASNTSGLACVEGTPVEASRGNFLEAVNLAASASLHDDIDLDFVRTGTLVLMVTPGPAVFNVDESLLRLTSARLIARQIGVELVSTSLPPLHVAPLFVLQTPKDAKQRDNSQSSRAGSEHVIPSWVETSFYQGPKDIKYRSTKCLTDLTESCEQGYHQPRQPHIPQEALAGMINPDAALLISRDSSGSPVDADISTMTTEWMEAHDQRIFSKRQDDEPTALVSQSARTVGTISRKAASMQHSLAESQGSRRSSIAARDAPLELLTMDQDHYLSERPEPTRSATLRTTRLPSIESHRSSKYSKLPPPPPSLLRGGLLFGKASATTSSTSELAHSSSHIVPSTPRSGDVSKSYADQVRASLSRKPSSQSVERSSISSTIAVDVIPVRPFKEVSDNTIPAAGSIGNLKADSVEEKSHNFFSGASSYSRRVKLGVIPSATKTQLHVPEDVPWFVISSPFKPRKSARKAFGEWNHVFTRQTQAYTLKWKALCTPASLPLTTEDHPSSAQLRDGYTESPYRLAVPEDPDAAVVGVTKRAHLARELIQTRISDGFQIAVGKKAHEITGCDDLDLYAGDLMCQEGAAVLLVKGDDVQLLCASAGEVAITRYQKRINLPRPMLYEPLIRTALEFSYEVTKLAFSTSADRNWNAVDNQIVSHELDNDGAAAIESSPVTRRRARFVLIPVEPSSVLSAAGSGNEDTDEEIRIEGIRRLTVLWQKNRWHRPSQQRHKASWNGHRDLNPLAIEYHTRDPSAVVAAGLESRTDGDNVAATTQLFNEMEAYRTSHVDLQNLALDLQSEKGIRVKTRRWHFKSYEYCFIGTEFTTFLMARFQDITNRQEAVDFGNVLLKKRFFHHVHGKHAFRDGQYFYSVAAEYRVPRQDSKSIGWFGARKEKGTAPSTPLSDRVKDSPETTTSSKQFFGGKKSRVCLNSSLQYNLDPRKSSTRLEIITVHYDRLHNPENAFHFEVEWQNATAKLVEDALTFWATTISRFGLKLVQLPVAEASMISQINPLRSPYLIDMAFTPLPTSLPSAVESPRLRPQQTNWPLELQKAILKKFNFVLDFEADTSFPTDVDVTYTWGTPGYRHAQYIHRSGVLIAQILSERSFLLLANRFYNNRAARSRDHISKDRTLDKADRERRGPSSNLPRSASALFSQGSPIASPLMRAVGDLPASPSLGNPVKKSATAEELKEKFEAFCKNARSLQTLFDDLVYRSPALPERPTPSLSAVSSGTTPLLQASIPSLDIAEEDDEGGGFTLSPRR